jgi:hypothetical protein
MRSIIGIVESKFRFAFFRCGGLGIPIGAWSHAADDRMVYGEQTRQERGQEGRGKRRGLLSSIDPQYDLQLQRRLQAALFWEIGKRFLRIEKLLPKSVKTRCETVVIVKRFSIIQSRNNS